MEQIFHERQEGSLCAQHCLNALLQGSYFTAVDLGAISEELDEQERERMAEGGLSTEEYRRFLNQPSSNMDDSGFFSVQVISRALEIWNLEMIPYASANPLAAAAREDPVDQTAFVCNFREHWFAIRKIGNQWFNLNSMLAGPELISETYLALFLGQLKQEGYSIFLVFGDLPPCEADALLKLVPAVQTTRPRLIREMKPKSGPETGGEEDDLAVLAALEASRNALDDDDAALQRAMELSLHAAGGAGFARDAAKRGADRIPALASTSVTSLDSDDSLKRAIELSLEASSDGASGALSHVTPVGPAVVSSASQAPREIEKTPSAQEIRERRLRFLEKNSNNNSDNANKDGVSNASPAAPDTVADTSKSTTGSSSSDQDVDDDEQDDKTCGGLDALSEEQMLEMALKMSRETTN